MPWQAALDVADPPEFSSVAFDVFDVPRRMPSRNELQQWFEPVAGHGLRMTEHTISSGRLTALEGTMRFRAPLEGDLALHLLLDSYLRLTIHCYRGNQGVTFVHLQDDSDRWVAYATQRQAGAVLPDRWAWTASDEGRVRRTMVRNSGAIQLRHHDGQLIISHGTVVLVRAPLAEPPDEIYFAGRVMPLGIELLKTRNFLPADLPADAGPEPLPPADEQVRTGAELAWTGSPAAATKAETIDTAWRFTADKCDRRGWLAAPLPGEGLYETIVELAEVTPGVGLFLGDGVQPPTHSLRFVKDTRSGQLGVMLQGDNDLVQNTWPVPTEQAVPLVTSAPWLRIVGGAAGSRWWISTDGQHWAEPPGPSSIPWPAVTHLGVQHVAGVPDCGLTIRSVRRRPLAALMSMAPPAVLGQASGMPAANLAEWEQKVSDSRPAALDAAVWRRAVALKTLAAGNLAAVGPLLVDLLLDDARQLDLPVTRQLRLLADAQLLLDARNQPALAVALAHRYHRLGLEAFERHDEYPVTSVRAAFLSTPLESRHAYPLSDPLAIRSELLMRLYADDWSGSVEFCRQTRFFQQHQQTPVFEWADELARRMTPMLDKPSGPPAARASRGRFGWGGRRGRGPGALTRSKPSWQHPLSDELSKETYNLLAELQGMLEGQAYDDAARTIAGLDPAQTPGLAPAADDHQLLLTLEAAVRRAAHEHPQLAVALERHFGAVAPLRVRQAAQSGDADAVQRVATLFPGTAAATEAHRWLGDRALALGWFALARAEYRRGLATVSDDAVRDQLNARLRMAAAMLGDNDGQPVTAAVQIGERTLAAAEFEQLTAEMRQRTGVRPVTTSAATLDVAVVPPPAGARQMVSRAVLDGALGENPNEEILAGLNRFQVDWAGRQLATVVVDNRLLVNNRFQLATYDLASGQRMWQTALPMGRKAGKAREWGLIAMRPLVLGQRVIARQLLSDGPALGCWDLATGQLTWLADTVKGLYAVSDPVVLLGRLVTVCAVRGDGADWSLRLVAWDPDRGEPLEQVELVRLQNSWQARHMCSVQPLEDGLVVSLGGAVLRCDGWGRVQWIRRQVVLPADDEPQWVQQAFAPPQVRQGMVAVVQPGVRSVECIDAETGQLLWRRCLPDVQELAAWTDERLLVTVETGLVALDPRSGQVLWRHAASGPISSVLAGTPAAGGPIAYVRSGKTADGKRQQLLAVWLDSATGQVAAEHPLLGTEDELPRLAAWLHHDGRWWAFFGRGPTEPKRELVELVTATPP